jgi:integrase
MSRVLTVRTVESVKPGSTRQEIPDRHLPGLYLIVQPSGHRSWAVRYRSGNRSRKHTLGPYPALDLKTARTLAGKALRAVAEGRDPGREKIQARALQPDTVEAVIQLFIERHCLRTNRPRTVTETKRLLHRHVLPRWRNRLLRDITRRDVLDLLDDIVDAGAPIEANRVLSATRKMFNWSLQRDILSASPCVGVKAPSAERPRDRVLSDEELGNVWRAADRLDGPFGALVKLLILTGQRRSEIGGLRWSEIDGELWTLPAERVKNGKQHDVPLSGMALDILASLPRIGETFVFSATGARPAGDYAQRKRRLDALLPADMPPWRLHDLRRTTASGLARLGVSLPTIERLLNHSSGSFAGIVGVYQRHDFAREKREAVETWARHVLALTQQPKQRRQPKRKNGVELAARG